MDWIKDDSQGHFIPAEEGEDVLGYMVFPRLVVLPQFQRVIHSLKDEDDD